MHSYVILLVCLYTWYSCENHCFSSSSALAFFHHFPVFTLLSTVCHTSYPFDIEEVANLDVCTAALFSRCESNQQIMRPYGGERSLQSMQRSTEALIWLHVSRWCIEFHQDWWKENDWGKTKNQATADPRAECQCLKPCQLQTSRSQKDWAVGRTLETFRTWHAAIFFRSVATIRSLWREREVRWQLLSWNPRRFSNL